jgi:hypothetical protein
MILLFLSVLDPHLNPLPEGEETIVLSPLGREIERGIRFVLRG